MNIAVKFLCLLLLLGVAGLFFLKNPDGEAWLSTDDFVPEISVRELLPRDLLASLKEFFRLDASITEQSVPVYRWKNKEGRWVYSDAVPSGIEAELIRVSTGANSDLYPGMAKKESDVIKPSRKNSEPGVTPSEGGMTNLLENSKNVEGLLQERKQKMDETLSRQ